jgi:hypothetical protein
VVPGTRLRDWAVGFGGGEEAFYRRRWRAPHTAIRLLCTWRLTPEEYDSWARAPVLEAGLLLSTEVKRRTTAGGGVLFTRRFAFSTNGDQRTSCMTYGAGPPRHRLGTPVCIGGGFPWRFGARAGESAFKKGFIPRVVAMPCFSPTRYAPSSSRSLLCAVAVAMALLVHPACF